MSQLTPASRVRGMSPYVASRTDESALHLDANEGCSTDGLHRYPVASDLEAMIADRWGVSPDQVVVTNGADDAIDRACRAMLEEGRALLTHTPSFEMIERSAHLAGGGVESVPWIDGAFDSEALLNLLTPSTRLVALVTPNNPTGAVIETGAIRRVAQAAPMAVVLVDLAYVEFADEDPTPELLDLPNVVVVRTFSKAWGLAGLRVGYALAPREAATWLRITGGPYPVSTPSLSFVGSRFEAGCDADLIARVRARRAGLFDMLEAAGLSPLPSQGNFITITSPCARDVHGRLLEQGVRTRWLDGPGWVRISIPASNEDAERLAAALRKVLP